MNVWRMKKHTKEAEEEEEEEERKRDVQDGRWRGEGGL